MSERRIYLVLIICFTLIVGCSQQNSQILEEPGPEVQASAAPSPTVLLTPTAAASLATEPASTESVLRAFSIDGSKSIARYRVEEEFFSGAVTNLGKELGLFTAVGWTREIIGEIVLRVNENGGYEFESGSIQVDISTLQSDEQRRDERIREQHLESLKFPLAEFQITKIEGLPGSYEEGQEINLVLTGNLIIREISNEEIFNVVAKIENGQIVGAGETQIVMVNYGFDPPEIPGFIKAQDPATIEIEIVAEEQQPL